MSEQGQSQPQPPEPVLPSLEPAAIAAKAASDGEVDKLLRTLKKKLNFEIQTNDLAAITQYRQSILWRRLNIAIGLFVGLTAAASGVVGGIAKNSLAAVIIGALSTFAAGSLAALNAGQRSARTTTAAQTYRELEATAYELRDVQLRYADPADVLRRVEDLTTRRQLVAHTVEAPSGRAFRLAHREQAERAKYRRGLFFDERSRVLWWRKPPPEVHKKPEVDQSHPTPAQPDGTDPT